MKTLIAIIALILSGCLIEIQGLNISSKYALIKQYQFNYYPKYNIYYSKNTKKWLIPNDCSWTVVKELPKSYNYLKIILSKKENIKCKTLFPFDHQMKHENKNHKNKIIVNSNYNPASKSGIKLHFTSR
ncbi:MAG: hypothetical protein U0W65_13850 [Bacteroidia bacterium]